jgi:uncharacterized BrkB/YihY/UPF0761 family membrane protein
VNAVRETIRAAVTQRSDEALIVVAISVVAAIYVASRWVRGVGRGLDALLERPHSSAGLGRHLRETLALVLLFSGALLLQFVGDRIATGVFGEGFLLRQGATYLLAAIAGACAYAYIYAFVAAPPRPPRAAVVAASAATMLLWIARTCRSRWIVATSRLHGRLADQRGAASRAAGEPKWTRNRFARDLALAPNDLIRRAITRLACR